MTRRIVLLATMLLSLWPTANAHSATRLQAYLTATDFANVTNTVDGDNVWPNGASCYRDEEMKKERVAPGTYIGALYCFSGLDNYDAIQTKLDAGFGAGAYKSLFDELASKTCVQQECTGVDCSKFVGYCWQKTKRSELAFFGTTLLASNDGSLVKDLRTSTGGKSWSDLQMGDIIVRGGGHVYMFVAWTDETMTTPGLVHASPTSHRVVPADNQSITTLDTKDFKPVASLVLLNDPDTQLVAFGGGQIDGKSYLYWETLSEDSGSLFLPFLGKSYETVQPSDLAIQGRGTTGGARYIVRVSGFPEVARLREISKSGKGKWLGEARLSTQDSDWIQRSKETWDYYAQ